jgi:hypothetical protein
MQQQYLKLCYIKRNWAWFTSCSLDLQTGEGWDIAPYELNADEPFSDHKDENRKRKKHTLIKVFFESDYADPEYFDLQYSVKMINNGDVPWLQTSPWSLIELTPIMVGTSLSDFIQTIKSVGGEVYLPSTIQL